MHSVLKEWRSHHEVREKAGYTKCFQVEGRLPLHTAAELEQVPGWCWHAGEGRRRFLAALKAARSEAQSGPLLVHGHDVSGWVLRCRDDWKSGRKMPPRLKVELRQIFGWKR